MKSFLICIVSIVILILGYVIFNTLFIRSTPRTPLTNTTNASRDVYHVLADYADKNNGNTPGADSADDSANDILRKLITKKYFEDESIFYVEGYKRTVMPDGNISNDQAIAPGENIFAYCLNTQIIDLAKRPLLISSLYQDVNGTLKADRKVLKGYAVVLHAHGLVSQYNITEAGEIIMDGQNLLDKNHPVWEGAPMDIRLPELLEKK